MLVDIEMPRMDGFDLTRNIRGDERTRDIPIIMITSRTASKHRNYAMELGVNEISWVSRFRKMNFGQTDCRFHQERNPGQLISDHIKNPACVRDFFAFRFAGFKI